MLKSVKDKEVEKWYNKLIFSKYRIKKLLYKSSYSYVFDGIYEKKATPVIVKIERKDRLLKCLESEVLFQILLKGFGIPKVLGFGFSSSCPVKIEEKLGPTIYEIKKKKN